MPTPPLDAPSEVPENATRRMRLLPCGIYLIGYNTTSTQTRIALRLIQVSQQRPSVRRWLGLFCLALLVCLLSLRACFSESALQPKTAAHHTRCYEACKIVVLAFCEGCTCS